MKILSIETSCDETAVSLLDISGPLEKPEITVLANALLSQMHLHAEFGGVYPNLAKREHQKNLPPLMEQVLKDAGENPDQPEIDCIAVTTGPGLEPALWVGITFAEELGRKWNKPVIPVNHMEGHVFSVLYGLSKEQAFAFPALALLVSGGHTELVCISGFGNYEVIGQTVDDAVGEAFDKVARILGLSYPGGPKISALAAQARDKNTESSITFPRPMLRSGDFNFSFSGLKTAVLYKVKAEQREDEEFKEEVARAFEDAAVEVLVEKTRRALDAFPDTKTLIVAGGVSANTHLSHEIHRMIEEFPEITLYFPTKELSTDNAVMIAIAAFVRLAINPSLFESKVPLAAKGNLSISSQADRS